MIRSVCVYVFCFVIQLISVTSAFSKQATGERNQKYFTIVTKALKSTNSDSIRLVLYSYHYQCYRAAITTTHYLFNDSLFRNRIIDKVDYISMGVYNKKQTLLTRNFLLICAGDSLEFTNDKKRVKITGTPNVEAQVALFNTSNTFHSNRWSVNRPMKLSVKDFNQIDTLTNIMLDTLEFYKHKLANNIYNILKTNILIDNQSLKEGLFIQSFGDANGNNYFQLPDFDKKRSLQLHLKYSDSLRGYVDKFADILKKYVQDIKPLLHYTCYAQLVLKKYYVDSCVKLNSGVNIDKFAKYINKRFSGILLQQLYMNIFVSYPDRNTDMRNFYFNANRVVKDSIFKAVLLSYKAKVLGSRFISFKMTDYYGNVFNSDSIRGKTLVFDCWYTGCPNCIILHSKLKPIEERFESNSKIVFVSVNVDQSIAQWLASVDDPRQLYTSKKENIINLNAGKQGKGHSMLQFYGVKGYPSLIIFDRKGNLVRTKDPRYDNGIFLISQLEKLSTGSN